MAFWLSAALLTFCACAALLWPFRRGGTAAPAAGHDVEVYRDQLRELDRDVARGALGAAEAQEARAEIGRRLLKAASGGDDGATGSGRTARIAASAAVLAVPLVAWGGYALTGSPAMEDQRLAVRLSRNPAQNSIEELIARAEGHLAANPSDARGWEVLAPIYMRTGRAADAVTAWRNTIRLDGATAAREASLGEALTALASGVVTAEAEEAFGRALALDASEPRARFFTAVALAQEGKADEAKARWRELAQSMPADSPWRAVVARMLDEEPAPAPQPGPPGPSAPGPSAEDMAAAAGMTPEDRRGMIETMVAGLDARLRDNPADPEGWQRLVRSHVVLGNAEAAADALARGVAALGADSEAGRALAALAGELGVRATQ